MPIFFNDDDQKVLFIHVPKTGGTTAERTFVHSGWEMRFRATAKSEPKVRPLRRSTPQHYHGALLSELLDLKAFDLVFLLVRDPIARFRSEYLHRNRSRPRLDAASVEAWARAKFAQLDVDPYLHDNHLRPQHEFLVEGAVVHRLENGMDAAFDDLSRRLGCVFRRGVRRGQDNHERSGVPSSAVEISPTLEALLRERYAEDFRAFGY